MKTAVLILAALVALLIVCSLEVFVAVVMLLQEQTEDEKVYFFEPLEKEISVEDMQKIVDANEKLVKELIDGNK